MPYDNERHENLQSDTTRVAVPVDVQILLAESRRILAETRYELNVRRGRGWVVPDSIFETEKDAF